MALTDRQKQAADQLIARMAEEKAIRSAHVQMGTAEEEPSEPSRGRKIFASLLLVAVAPASALPIFAAIAIVIGLLFTAGGVSALWVAPVMLAILLPLAWLLVRMAVQFRSNQHLYGWRRWWPQITTAVGVLLLIWVFAKGGRVDALMLLWLPVGILWSIALLARIDAKWKRGLALLWIVLPLCVVTVTAARASKGFFDFRFHRSVAVFDTIATTHPDSPPPKAGWFTITSVHKVRDCQVGYAIKGWWRDDKRTIAYCPDGRPSGDVDHLEGDWYDMKRHG